MHKSTDLQDSLYEKLDIVSLNKNNVNNKKKILLRFDVRAHRNRYRFHLKKTVIFSASLVDVNPRALTTFSLFYCLKIIKKPKTLVGGVVILIPRYYKNISRD